MIKQVQVKIASLRTPSWLYGLHRRLFCMTHGFWNSILTKLIQWTRPKEKIDVHGIIDFEITNIQTIVKQIQKDGFFVFQETLDDKTIDEIVSFCQNTPIRFATIENGQNVYSSNKVKYSESQHIDSPRFQMDAEDILASPLLTKLTFDHSLCAIAQEYFQSRPVLDLISLWWSRPSQTTQHKDFAAQKFHFDMDRIKFLKFFFYLTDVDENNGPHVFVKGSNAKLPTMFYKDRRFEDEEIEKNFQKDKIVQFCKKRGSIFAVDTSGLHKGESVIEGERLIFQIEFSNSMFGQYYEKVSMPTQNPLAVDHITSYPLIYKPLFRS